MKTALKIINELEEEGFIERYALGGATALLFYAEPSLTFDVDVFVFLPGTKDPKRLINLGPLYKALKTKGYSAEKEYVLIKEIPIQFIPAYNPLIVEAVEKAMEKKYEGIKTKVLTLEHLLAIMVDTNRPKDRERIKNLLGTVPFDKKSLGKILDRHSLRIKWEKIIEKASY